MIARQLSVFLENKPGRIAAVTRSLGRVGINLRALSIADTADFGVLRLIVSDPDAAIQYLKADGFTVNLTDVIAAEVPDRPGGLAHLMDVLEAAKVNIEYLYAFCEKESDNALAVFRVENLDEAELAIESLK